MFVTSWFIAAGAKCMSENSYLLPLYDSWAVSMVAGYYTHEGQTWSWRIVQHANKCLLQGCPVLAEVARFAAAAALGSRMVKLQLGFSMCVRLMTCHAVQFLQVQGQMWAPALCTGMSRLVLTVFCTLICCSTHYLLFLCVPRFACSADIPYLRTRKPFCEGTACIGLCET